MQMLLVLTEFTPLVNFLTNDNSLCCCTKATTAESAHRQHRIYGSCPAGHDTVNIESTDPKPPTHRCSQVKLPSHRGSQFKPPSHQGSQLKPPSHQGSQFKLPSHQGSQLKPPSHQGSQLKPPSHQGSQQKLPSHQGSQLKPPSHQGSQLKPQSHQGSQLKSPSHQGSQLKPLSHQGSQLKPLSQYCSPWHSIDLGLTPCYLFYLSPQLLSVQSWQSEKDCITVWILPSQLQTYTIDKTWVPSSGLGRMRKVPSVLAANISSALLRTQLMCHWESSIGGRLYSLSVT